MAGTISAIEVQARNPRRVNVYLDGAYAFALSLDVATAANLRRGLLLSDDAIAGLVAQDEWQKTYDATLNFLSYRPRSEEEVRRYLNRRGVPEETRERLVSRLRQSKLLDDEAFARYWVENRHTFSPRSKRALQSELRSKGIDDATVQESLSGDDSDAAYRAALKKMRSLALADYETFRRKLIPFLQRRGFSYETARAAAQKLWAERDASKTTD
jgi:regulatory protein